MTNMWPALQEAQTVLFDFDGTIAQTFTPSPSKMDVARACNLALKKMFGISSLAGLPSGLANRTPVELIRDVLRQHPFLRAHAYEFANSKRPFFASLMHEGKGVPFAPVTRHNEIPQLAEIFVRLKLELLLSEMGGFSRREWPQPCEGVLDFIDMLRLRGVQVGIISAGHDLFIQRCFKQWGVGCPKWMITDDDMRGLDRPIHEKVKPSRLLFDMLLRKMDTAREEIDSVVYFGDDVHRDGILAKNAGVPFGLYNPSGSWPPVTFPRSGDIAFSSWRLLMPRETA